MVNNTSTITQKGTAPIVDQKPLFHAIDSATLDRVQSVLREICSELPEAFKLASEKLLVSDGGSNAGAKRKRDEDAKQQRYEICDQCDQEYDVLDNDEDACVWHSGKFSSCSTHAFCCTSKSAF
jgi:hypothetical protein